MPSVATITFANDHTAAIAQFQGSASLSALLVGLGVPQARPTIVLVGGASRLAAADLQRVRSLFTEAIVPLAQKWQAVVVDGGTDAGIMQLMGAARAAAGAKFALVGVCPTALVFVPGQRALRSDVVPLEPHHTHFVMVPGDRWGDESKTLAQVATTIAAGMPSVTVLINGGEITWEDAKANLEERRSLVVVEGTGRTADVLAAAMESEAAGGDERAVALLRTGLVRKVALAAGSEGLIRVVEEVFAAGA
jgi:hypothetical protein